MRTQVKRFQGVFYGTHGKNGYPRSFITPGAFPGSDRKVLSEDLEWLKNLMREANITKNYSRSTENYDTTAHEYLELMIFAMEFAGLVGEQTLTMYMISEIPIQNINIPDLPSAIRCVL